MCGIFGILNLDSSNVENNTLRSMGAAIRHRGPDDEGYVGYNLKTGLLKHYLGDESSEHAGALRGEFGNITNDVFDADIALGHRRLSILDTTFSGHQPMSYFSERYVLVFNGEIYNYIEIREELLAQGYVFESNSDTEVVLAAYAHWGVECANKFNGDWALALLDTTKNTIYLSRDRFGIKPLYYWFDGSTFIFASEMKAIIEHPKVSVKPSVEYFQDFLKSGLKSWAEQTPFVGIKRFPSAHWSVLDLDTEAEIKFQRYWKLDHNAKNETYDAVIAKKIADQYYALLKDALKIRMRADVPLGFALSGGLDSSSLVYLANEIRNELKYTQPIKTFSAVYNSPEAKHCDESYFIDLLESNLSFSSFKKEPISSDVPAISERVAREFETLPDGSGISGANTIKLAKDIGLSVTIEGQGADEVQAGYERYLLEYLYSVSWHELIKFTTKYLFARSGTIFSKDFLIFSVFAKFAGRTFSNYIMKKLGKNIVLNGKGLNSALQISVEQGLSNLLHYGDARSMAISIESRMPFMDHRLIEFCLNVPACYKVHNGFSKYFARLAFDGKLPDEITWRRDKMGWPSPQEAWFEGSLKEWSQHAIKNSMIVKELAPNIVSPTNVKTYVRLLNVAMWEKVFLK